MTTSEQVAGRELARVLAGLPERCEVDRESLVALCGALVAAPSVNPPGDTRAVADVVAAALAERGLDARLEFADPHMPSVLSSIDSGRPGPHLVLNVHMDTMPAGDPATWTVPILELTRRDGRLYGLGMGNMKGAVAAMISAFALLAEERAVWSGRVTLAAVSDEVVFGDNGAAYLLRTHPDLLGDGLICGEGPGFRRLALGEKGVLWLRIRAEGAAGHSSSVQAGASASARIAAAVLAIDALTGGVGALPADLAGLTAPPGDPGLRLTANVGTVAAGTFIGQVATTATAEVDLRLPPGISADAAQQLVEQAVSDIPQVSVERLRGWDANWTSPQSPLARCWTASAQTLTGEASAYAIRLPASDASRWRTAGVPALCYGPQPTYSAGVDDYAEEDEVVRCAALYAATALRFLQPEPVLG